MSDAIIPVETRRAAARGFIRTTAQALATVIPTGAVTGAVLSGMDWRVVLWSVLAAVVGSVLAGLASALSIIAKGIPEEYAPPAPEGGRVLPQGYWESHGRQ